MKLHYSILRFHPIQSHVKQLAQFNDTYAPITSHADSIILGILFHEPSLDFREFRYTFDLSHFSEVCPDMDVRMIERLLRGIKEDVESKEFETKPFDIEEYTRFWINDFCFGEIKRVEYDELNETIKLIDKEYL